MSTATRTATQSSRPAGALGRLDAPALRCLRSSGRARRPAPTAPSEEESVPIQPPSRAELTRIAEEYRLGLSEEELDVFAEIAGPTLTGFVRLDELPDESL